METNVNDDPHNGASKIHSSKGGGGAGKLIAGALAAAVLVGGGYYVWKSMSPGDNTSEIAYNDGYASEPMRAGPMDPLDSPSNTQDTVIDDAEPAATAASPATTPRPATARRSTVRTAEVPVETIGVTPASVTMEDDDIVVTAPRRPVWTRTPSARRLEALYPARALEREREGEATLHCTVAERGALDCVRAEETPGGFGTAAMRVARTLRHAETFADGSDATGSPVNLRVVFRISDEEPRRDRFASR
jgi:protein TonB